MIGNDIISLALIKADSASVRPGFVEKVCPKEEFQAMCVSFSPLMALWVLWAAKESAYKVYLKDGGPAIFAPKRFVFKLKHREDNILSGYTQTPKGKYCTQISVQPEFILAEAWSEGIEYEDIIRAHFPLPSDRHQDQSSELRQLIRPIISQYLNIRADQLQIEKNALGVPIVLYHQKQLPFSLSLSHHGLFGAFCGIGVGEE